MNTLSVLDYNRVLSHCQVILGKNATLAQAKKELELHFAGKLSKKRAARNVEVTKKFLLEFQPC